MLEFLGFKRAFRKLNSKVINTFSFPYDFRSVMHYGAFFFTKNGKPTIEVKQAGVGFAFMFTGIVEKLKSRKQV